MFDKENNDKGGFYMMPRLLFTEACPLSLEAKVLYTMIIDRTDLSLKNNWRDKQGRIYIYFTVEEAAKLLGCSSKKAGKLISELELRGYIQRKVQGLGKPVMIYLNRAQLPTFARSDESYPLTGQNVLS